MEEKHNLLKQKELEKKIAEINEKQHKLEQKKREVIAKLLYLKIFYHMENK